MRFSKALLNLVSFPIYIQYCRGKWYREKQGQLLGHKNKAVELQNSGLLHSKVTVCTVNNIFRRREEGVSYLPSPVPSPPHPMLKKLPWFGGERREARGYDRGCH